MEEVVTIIGGGLAGAEAAWRLGLRGTRVRLFEMRPGKLTPAHRSGRIGELVCSNSLKSMAVTNASGLLKAELEALDSLVMQAARATAVPAGSALAVDREKFADAITEQLESLPGLSIVREEVTTIPERGLVIIATGPLTSPALSSALRDLAGEDSLFFYDAIAPIVVADSIDYTIAFRASRYDKGGDDYINCPMSEAEYARFWEALLSARKVSPREFEEPKYFEGCLPLEVMAERGRETLAHGPMKPVGLRDPRTGTRPYAVVQLRQDDAEGKLYNMVGFQTRLAWPEQERVFRMVPGLAQAQFARLGSIHRNTFINSPRLLAADLSLRADPRLFFAGQLTGVEGYLESAAGGIIAGLNVGRRLRGLSALVPPATTMIGALIAYVTDPARADFQPMNASFGLLPALEGKIKRSEKKELLAKRAMADLQQFANEINK